MVGLVHSLLRSHLGVLLIEVGDVHIPVSMFLVNMVVVGGVTRVVWFALS